MADNFTQPIYFSRTRHLCCADKARLQPLNVLVLRLVREARTGFPLGPSFAGKQCLRLIIVKADKISKRKRLPSLLFECLKPIGDLISEVSQICTNIRQDILSRQTVELDT